MNGWKATTRISLLLCVAIGLPVAYASLYRPLLRRAAELERRERELSADVRRLEARLAELKDNQERLETDSRFVEKIAREELGYAKEGETVFRFVEEP
ncbi:MAG: septum formation initiator family protein [Kiritimatiellae bacterium]|nr:septum formation initiator family protein [Kiritimatiellia bacterium]